MLVGIGLGRRLGSAAVDRLGLNSHQPGLGHVPAGSDHHGLSIEAKHGSSTSYRIRSCSRCSSRRRHGRRRGCRRQWSGSGRIKRRQILLGTHLQIPTLLHHAHILAALSQVDVRVLLTLDGLVLDGGVARFDVGRELLARHEMMPLKVAHGHVDGPDGLGIQHRALGAVLERDVGAVHTTESDLSHGGRVDRPTGRAAFVDVPLVGREAFHLLSDEA